MGRITNINIVDSGAEYYSAPVVTISAPNADSETAIATLTIVDGVITLVSVANGGTYYTSTPTVTVTDISYIPIATATATAVLEYKGGGVSSINLDSAGSYYIDVSPADTVLIDSPLSVLPDWYKYVSLSSQWGQAYNLPAILDTLNPQQSIGTLKFQHYARSNTLLNDSGNFAATNLIGTDNFRLQWADSNKINFDIRSSIDSSWQNIFTNRPISLNQLALNDIEFSWGGNDRFMLWVNNSLEYSRSITDLGLVNQLFSNDGLITFGDSNSLQIFDKVYFYNDVSDSYSFASNIVFSELFDLGELVTATAVATRNTYGDIRRIDVTNAGSGYYSAPNVTIAAPTGAIENYPIYITANTTIGSVTSFNIVAEGGIIDSANIVITAPTGSKSDFQATAITTIDSVTNKIASITITDSGNFYDSATISIGLPAANDFNIGDIVYQELSGGIRMQGEVALWNDSDNKLSLIHIGADDGKFHTFVAGGRILSTRQEYGRTVANKIIISIQEENKISESEQNDYFNELTDFLDFSETNPFGDPS